MVALSGNAMDNFCPLNVRRNRSLLADLHQDGLVYEI